MDITYIAIVEDQVETRENLEEYFSLIPGFECSISVGSVECLLEQLECALHHPTIILHAAQGNGGSEKITGQAHHVFFIPWIKGTIQIMCQALDPFLIRTFIRQDSLFQQYHKFYKDERQAEAVS